MSVELDERAVLKEVHPTDKWSDRVDAMSDDQVNQITLLLLSQEKL